MGRQAARVTRALGRSPYERLEIADFDEFEARQAHSGRQDAGFYIQKYDHRGQPENLQSKAAARQLRRAQNDVLYSVGVVGKNDEQHRVDEAILENTYGLLLQVLVLNLTTISGWWISSLRARFQTYEYYSILPLAHMQQIQRSHFGPFGFYFAGLPFSMLAWVLNPWYNPFLKELTEFVTKGDESTLRSRYWEHRWSKQLDWANKLTNIFFLTCSIPPRIFSMLQILQLVPATTLPPFRALLPLQSNPILGLPGLPHMRNVSDIFRFGYALSMSPFFLTLTYETTYYIIGNTLSYMFRKAIPKPDRPDQISLRAAFEESYDETDIPGLVTTRRPPRSVLFTLLDDIKSEYSALMQWIQGKDTFDSADSIRPEHLSGNEARGDAVTTITSHLVRADSEHHVTDGHNPAETSILPNPNSAAPAPAMSRPSTPTSPIPEVERTSRHHAHVRNREIESLSSSDPRRQYLESLAEVYQRARHIYHAADLSPILFHETHDTANTRLIAQMSDYCQFDLTTSSALDLQRRIETLNQCMQEFSNLFPQRAIPTAISLPSPSSSSSSSEPDSMPALETPTPDDDDDNNNRFPSSIRIPLEAILSATNNHTTTEQQSTSRTILPPPSAPPPLHSYNPYHRVTLLTNFPADTLASHFSTLLTTLLLLPLESVMLRSIALSSPSAASSLALSDRRTVRGLGVWFGGGGGGGGAQRLLAKLGYAATVLLLLGMQTATYNTVWRVGCGVATRIGRGAFGWGKL